MINLIPSKDVRDYIEKSERVFTDAEKATIICNLGMSFEMTKEELQKIADNSENQVLKAQISEWIKHRNQNSTGQEDMLFDDFASMGFENTYIDIPNPFERGDIVRLTTNGGHGIVSISQNEWNKYNELAKAAEYADFSDASILVDIVTDSGDIVHNHICPIFLEKYEPTEGDKDCDILLAGSGVYTGNCGLDWFAICYDNYKRKCKNEAECEK